MVGMFPNVLAEAKSNFSRKRKIPKGVLNEEKQKEDKRIRVEQVVTALNNTEKREDVNRRSVKSPIEHSTDAFVYGAATSGTSGVSSSSTTEPIRNRLNKENSFTNRFMLPSSITTIHQSPVIHSSPLNVSKPRPSVSSKENVSVNMSQFPTIQKKSHPLHNNDFKNADIIRVPRDNKTPFVVFRPEHHAEVFTSSKMPTSSSPSLPGNRKIPLDPHPGANITDTPQLPLQNSTDPFPFSQERVGFQNWSAFLVPGQKRGRSSYRDMDTRIPDGFPNRLSDWSIDDVYDYLSRSDCCNYAGLFKSQEIDGHALILLDEINISKLLDVKMGPAIKLANLIRTLISKQ